jgi:hypothetical protein
MFRGLTIFAKREAFLPERGAIGDRVGDLNPVLRTR